MTREFIETVDRLSFYKKKEGVEIYCGYKEIYDQIRRRNMAIRDDYVYWALHDEQSEYGKVFLMDASDTSTHQIFFDDCCSYILNAMDIHDTERHIAFEEIDGIHAVHVNSYDIMVNDSYFIEQLVSAQKNFDEKYGQNK